MRRSKFRRPCKVLIFNGARVLVAIVRSLHCAAELTHENKSAIHNCCTGKSVRSGAYYYPLGVHYREDGIAFFDTRLRV